MPKLKFWLIPTLLCLAAPAAAQDGADAGAPVLEPDTVLVTRGEASVTVRDFEAFLRTVPDEHRTQVANSPERIAELLGILAKNRLLALRAREDGLDDDPDIRAEIEAAEDRILARAHMRQVVDNLEPADYEQQAKEYYLTHQDEFRTPERVSVTHLLIGTRERDRETARELAKRVAGKARAGDLPFEELAAEYTDDPAFKNNQGHYTVKRDGRMVEAFEEAAFGLEEVGDISGPVETPYGFHVIRLESRQPAEQRPFEAVRDKLVDKQRERHVAQARQDYINKLMLENELEADPDLISALRERYRYGRQPSTPEPATEQ